MNKADIERRNAIVSAGMPILRFIVNIKNFQNQPNTNELHQAIMNDLSKFRNIIKRLTIDQFTGNTIDYCLCTVVDEAILSSSWGLYCGWSEKTLLQTSHNENQGGEHFYTILENLLRSPKQNIDVIELMYLLLSLGYEGKYSIQGTHKLKNIFTKLYQTIANHRDYSSHKLKLNWQDKSLMKTEQARSKKLIFL